MENGSTVAEKAQRFSASLYPKHDAMLIEIAFKRKKLNKSELLQEAIEDLARRELDPERFEQLMAGAA